LRGNEGVIIDASGVPMNVTPADTATDTPQADRYAQWLTPTFAT
jgi:hypothetical protein